MLISYILFKENDNGKHISILALSKFIIEYKIYIEEIFNINIKPEWVYYYIKYTVSFIRSFLILILCVDIAIYTNSKRLYGLTIFLILSMWMDLLSIVSTDLYYIIKPYRYTNFYNFKDLYSTFEVLCVLYPFINFTFRFIKTTINNHINRHDVFRTSSSLENVLTLQGAQTTR